MRRATLPVFEALGDAPALRQAEGLMVSLLLQRGRPADEVRALRAAAGMGDAP